MKAKHLKQHIKKQEIEEEVDEFENQVWVVEGRKFRDKEDAKKYIAQVMEEEFRNRFKNKKH